MAKKKPNWGAIGLGIFGAVVLIVSVIVFLTNKEGYGDYKPISGWEALKMQGAGFWIIAIILNIIGGFVVYGVVANETGGGWLGRKMEGKTSTTIFLILLASALIFGPWGKACTDKANAGVTAPNYQR